MANYINHTNQTLLWNTVNKLPDFQKLSPPKKDFEFKKTIEYIYNTSCRNKQFLTLQELQQLNRETILAFVKIEKKETEKKEIEKNSENSEKPPLYPQQPPPQKPLFETKQEQSQRQFEERQNIYKQMNSKPELPSPEIFKDKIEDTAIENMDALIQQYQKQRELEFQQYTPPPPVSSTTTTTSSTSKPKIRILDNNVSLNSIDIEEDVNTNTNKKNVSWSTNQNVEYVIDDYWDKKLEYWDKKLEEANKEILKLEKRVFLLEEKLMDNEIKQEVTFTLEKIIQQI